jgi:hypothetical protein
MRQSQSERDIETGAYAIGRPKRSPSANGYPGGHNLSESRYCGAILLLSLALVS